MVACMAITVATSIGTEGVYALWRMDGQSMHHNAFDENVVATTRQSEAPSNRVGLHKTTMDRV